MADPIIVHVFDAPNGGGDDLQGARFWYADDPNSDDAKGPFQEIEARGINMKVRLHSKTRLREADRPALEKEVRSGIARDPKIRAQVEAQGDHWHL
jgi:hypothetical protein